MPTTIAVIPAFNEEMCIAGVVADIRPHVDGVVVVDNGSTDRTAGIARAAGAYVESEPRRGYGRACLTGMSRAKALGATIILFLDGDGSDAPEDARALIAVVARGEADLALGVRTPALTERGAMTPPQRFGNWLAPRLMRLTLGSDYRDMPPLKACAVSALDALRLRDEGHGFIIEMLLKAHRMKLRVVQMDVRCRVRRGGTSKVSGTIRGVTRASAKIMFSIARHAIAARAGLEV